MGLFDFLKKKSKPTTPAAPKPNVNSNADEMIRNSKLMVLENTIAALGLNVSNLNVDFFNNTATVSGIVTSESDRLAIVNAINRVDGVFSVNDRLEVNVPAPQFETYTIKKGDSLSRIAKHYYGDAMRYKEIFEANKDILDNPNKIFPGQEIKIPLGN